MAAGEDCRAAAWWCSALTGLVLHAAQYVTAADSAFALALEGMPGDRRCSWEDASDLLPPRAARIYRALSCEERRHWLAPVWTLADPSWTRAGNDRRTEHYARLVMSQLDRQSRSAYSMSWGGDTHELIVRYGWPERWSRGSAPTLDPSNINVIGHEPHPAFDFFPDDSAIGVPSMIAPSRWNYRDPTARSRYAPPYARRVVPLESQVAAFRRGDSALVVAAFNAPADTAFDPRSLTAAIGIDHDLARPNTTVVPVTVQDGRTRARIAVPPSTCEPRADSTTACPGSDALLVGLELSDSSHRSLAIARHWLPMQAHGDLGLLLYADPRGTDATLDDVLPRALGAFRTSRRDRLGLYWEYDHAGADADSVRTVLTVYPRSASWLTRLARSMRLAEAAAPVHVEFTEPLSGGMRHTRTLGVSLAHLPPGTYDVRVRIETNAREISRTTRTLALTP